MIDHPLVKSGYDDRGSIQIPQVKKIRALAANLFTPTGVRPKGFDTMPDAGQRPDEEPVQVVDVRDPAQAPGDPEAHAEADAQAHRQADEAPEGDARADARAAAVRGRRRRTTPPAAGGERPSRLPGDRPPDPHDPGPVRWSSSSARPGPASRRSRRATSPPTRCSRPTPSAGVIAGDPGDQAATRPAFAALHRALARRMADRRLTVVDATSVQRHARLALLRVAAGAGVPAVAIVLDLPSDIVRARNRGRATGSVPDDAVDAQLADLAAALRPGALDAEGFAAIHRLTRTEDVDAVEIRRA